MNVLSLLRDFNPELADAVEKGATANAPVLAALAGLTGAPETAATIDRLIALLTALKASLPADTAMLLKVEEEAKAVTKA